MTGTTISHYSILSELGRGGMGIVYRALDERLGREVALKVLPAAALSNADDRARFYREARAAASLTHPHIAVVHEIDEAAPEGSGDAQPFIAMELIDGESLEARIKQGPLKLDEAVRIASEIASGLDAAHAQEIVHRDIKASNVMLTAKDEAKILDFGLAQTSASTKLTRQGATVGTVAYMSPEQARGEEVDLRTDLWSLGVVLYEMIAGRHPFPGEYDQAVLYGVLNQDPEPLTAVRTGVPIELDLIVDKCLQKDSRHRYQHADDLIADLSRISAGPSSSSRAALSAISRTGIRSVIHKGPKGWITWRTGAALVVGAVIMAAASVLLKSPQPVPPAPLAAEISVRNKEGRHLAFYDPNARIIAISPDGSKIVFTAYLGDAVGLYLLEYPSYYARPIVGAEYGVSPVFSPDGSQLAYVDALDGGLYTVGLGGGGPRLITENTGSGYTTPGLAWVSDELLIFGRIPTSGLSQIAVDGSGEMRLTQPDRSAGHLQHKFPHVLPDGSGFIFTIRNDEIVNSGDAIIAHYDFESDSTTELFTGGTDGRVLTNGYLLYVKDFQLYAVKFDGESRSVGDDHRPVADRVYFSNPTGAGHFAISGSGTLAFIKNEPWTAPPLQIRDREGAIMTFELPEFPVQRARLSPDGSRVIVEMVASNNVLYLARTDRPELQRFSGRANSVSPVWTPDGNWVTFLSDREGSYSIYRQEVASGETEMLYSGVPVQSLGNWSRDGRTLVLIVPTSEHGRIWKLSLDSTWTAEPLVQPQGIQGEGAISPDGTLLLYLELSESTSMLDLYVQRLSNGVDRIRLAADVEPWPPVWDDSGGAYYVSSDSPLQRTQVSANGVLRADAPQQVLPGHTGNPFDVSGDGSRFLTFADSSIYGLPVLEEIRVVTGWTTWLESFMESRRAQ